MREVSDDFLLNMAEVSAALIGLFMVGVFFFADTGFRRLDRARGIVEPYFRASTRIVLVLYTLPLGLSLSLVALEPVWSRVLFALLSLLLLAANLDTAARIRAVARVTGSTALLVNELVGTAAVVTIVALPWVLGGLHPTREDLAWAILLAFAAGFTSISALVLFVQDLARFEAGGGDEARLSEPGRRGSPPPPRPAAGRPRRCGARAAGRNRAPGPADPRGGVIRGLRRRSGLDGGIVGWVAPGSPMMAA
ncbi:MAG TPA: hypothetical protein VG673_07895 [Actinomycetota bacterium]|nr:hypothetical protein [Actinomycetota bacterium]